jgi:hypothetical protein
MTSRNLQQKQLPGAENKYVFDSGSVLNIYWLSGILQIQIKESCVGQIENTAWQREELIPGG